MLPTVSGAGNSNKSISFNCDQTADIQKDKAYLGWACTQWQNENPYEAHDSFIETQATLKQILPFERMEEIEENLKQAYPEHSDLLRKMYSVENELKDESFYARS